MLAKLIVIESDRLRSARWRADPFPHAVMDQLVREPALQELVATFPTDKFVPDEPTPNHARLQYTRTLAVRAAEDIHYRDDDIPSTWRDLLNDLLSNEYVDSLSQSSGRQLTGSSYVISIWRMPPGGFNSLHGTSARKLLSQLFYFTPDWLPAWGGQFELRADDEAHTTVQSILPTAGRSVAFLATPASWHSVSHVVASERRSLSVHFFQPGADLSWFIARAQMA